LLKFHFLFQKNLTQHFAGVNGFSVIASDSAAAGRSAAVSKEMGDCSRLAYSAEAAAKAGPRQGEYGGQVVSAYGRSSQ